MPISLRRVDMPMWAFVLVVFLALGLGGLAATGAKDDTASLATPSTPAPAAGAADTTAVTFLPTPTTLATAKSWKAVTALSGAAQKRSGTFHLSGAQARLRYQATTSFLSIYVVEAGHSLEKDGGFPEVTCTKNCSDDTQLAKDAGDYYLEVNGSGAWSVTVEEFR